MLASTCAAPARIVPSTWFAFHRPLTNLPSAHRPAAINRIASQEPSVFSARFPSAISRRSRAHASQLATHAPKKSLAAARSPPQRFKLMHPSSCLHDHRCRRGVGPLRHRFPAVDTNQVVGPRNTVDGVTSANPALVPRERRAARLRGALRGRSPSLANWFPSTRTLRDRPLRASLGLLRPSTPPSRRPGRLEGL